LKGRGDGMRTRELLAAYGAEDRIRECRSPMQASAPMAKARRSQGTSSISAGTPLPSRPLHKYCLGASATSRCCARRARRSPFRLLAQVNVALSRVLVSMLRGMKIRVLEALSGPVRTVGGPGQGPSGRTQSAGRFGRWAASPCFSVAAPATRPDCAASTYRSVSLSRCFSRLCRLVREVIGRAAVAAGV
jgi:hypothetical protein